MQKIHFQQYLKRLYELGEIGVAMDESKTFLDSYASKNELTAAVDDLAKELAFLQGRLATLEKDMRNGIMDRRDLIKERNEISQAFQYWLEEFKNKQISDLQYQDFGQNLSINLHEKIFGKVENSNQNERLDRSKRRWIIGLFGIFFILFLGFGLKYLFQSDPDPQETGCMLTAGPLTFLFAEHTPFSERISQLPRGKKYKILDKQIYDHFGLKKYTFYKIDDGNGNTGWVEHDPNLNVPANCR